jgi:hypothetical protein
MAGEDVATEPAEPLGMNNVEVTANPEGGRQSECKHRRKSIDSPGGKNVKMDIPRAVAVNPVSKNVNFMLLCETVRQLGHIAAMPTGAMIVMH